MALRTSSSLNGLMIAVMSFIACVAASTACASREVLNMISKLGRGAKCRASSLHRTGAARVVACINKRRAAPESSQRELQPHHSALVLGLVIGNQKHALRINLCAGQQGLLKVRRSLLPQGRQIGVADRNVLTQFAAEELESGRRYLRLGLQRGN